MYHHSFEHAFHYPSIPHATPIAPAAEAGAAAAAAASHAPHFRPGPGMMYSHYHPHAFRFRRFGMFRRFFWPAEFRFARTEGVEGAATPHRLDLAHQQFGAGAAVATWFYNKQQRIAAANASIATTADSSSPTAGAAAAGASDRSWSGWHDRWHARHDKQYQQYQQAGQQQQQQAMRVDHQPPPVTATAYEYPSSTAGSSPLPVITAGANAVPTAPLVAPSVTNTQVEQTASNERQWGWRARQRMRQHEKQKEREAAAAQAAAAAAAIADQEKAGATAAAETHEQDDMVRIKEAVDRLYAEKMREMQSMQEKANEKAKEFARDKLDQLSVALETLRQSLKKDEDVKAALEKKLV